MPDHSTETALLRAISSSSYLSRRDFNTQTSSPLGLSDVWQREMTAATSTGNCVSNRRLQENGSGCLKRFIIYYSSELGITCSEGFRNTIITLEPHFSTVNINLDIILVTFVWRLYDECNAAIKLVSANSTQNSHYSQ